MHYLRTLMVMGGVVCAMLGIGMWMLPAMPAQAQPLPLPDRPTLTPRPVANDDDDEDAPVAPGRISGTVIDARTGAPAAGLPVQVGTVLVSTDANGNYDLAGLAPGTYALALALTTEQGLAEQAALSISVPAGASVVQHLLFRSPAPAAAAVPAALPATGGNESAAGLFAAGVLLLLLAGLVRRQA